MFEIVSASPGEVADFEVDDNEVEIEDFDGEFSGTVVSFTLFNEGDAVCVQVIDDATSDDDDDDD